jgi:hypothetical protein
VRVRADELTSLPSSSLPSPSLPPSPLPPSLPAPSLPPRSLPPSPADAIYSPRGRIFNFFNFFLVVVAGWKEIEFTIYNFRFSVFNPQNPQNPQTPRTPQAPRASRAKPQEEEGFFGLVPLVTHPSSLFPSWVA